MCVFVRFVCRESLSIKKVTGIIERSFEGFNSLDFVWYSSSAFSCFYGLNVTNKRAITRKRKKESQKINNKTKQNKKVSVVKVKKREMFFNSSWLSSLNFYRSIKPWFWLIVTLLWYDFEWLGTICFWSLRLSWGKTSNKDAKHGDCVQPWT